MIRRLAVVALVGALAVSAAACSGSDGTTKALPAHRAASTDKKPTSTTTAPFASAAKDVPGTLQGFVGAKADVHDTKCVQHGGSWNASGVVTNPTAHAVKYRIYVSLLNGDTTVGLVEANTGRVGPKASTGWAQGIKVGGTDLRCILRVERASV